MRDEKGRYYAVLYSDLHAGNTLTPAVSNSQQGMSQMYEAAWADLVNLGAQNVYGDYAAQQNAYQRLVNQQRAPENWLPVTCYRGSRYATPKLHPIWGVTIPGYRRGR